SDHRAACDRHQSWPWLSRHRFARFVSGEDTVADGVAQTVEEAAAPVDVTPAFPMSALGIVAHVQEIGPGGIVHRGRIDRTDDMCFAAIVEFVLRTRTAPRTDDQQPQCATAAAAASSISRPVRNRSSAN